MATVFLNGQFVERDAATVSAFDAGFQHAVGLFETMLGVRSGGGTHTIMALQEHTERLAVSAAALDLSRDMSAEALGEACMETFRRSELPRARIRLTVTGGDLNLLETQGKTTHRPTILITSQPATDYPAEMFEKGVLATVADAKANPLDPTASHKTLNYWWRLRELQRAAAKGAGEAIVFQVSNHAGGGCVSNLLAVHGDRVLTPICRGEEPEGSLPSPVLPGVTRARVLGWAEEAGLEVSRQMLTIDDLLGASEVMLTNSSWGVLPVTQLESRQIGEGRPGEVSRSIVERWRRETDFG